jgi:hypothetical protein
MFDVNLDSGDGYGEVVRVQGGLTTPPLLSIHRLWSQLGFSS